MPLYKETKQIGCSACWGSSIQQMNLRREARLCNEYPVYDPKPCDGETPVLELWGISSISLPSLLGLV